MAAASVSTYTGLVRSLWPQTKIYEELFKHSPLLGMLPKDTSFSENHRYIAVGIGAPQGTGPDFTVAKANKTSSVSREFDIQAVTYYGLISIDGRLMRMAANGNKAVIVKPLERETTNVIHQIKRDFSAYVHGDGGGAIGRIASGQTTTTITLATAGDIRNFEIGQTVTTSTTADGTGTIKGGSLTVTGVGDTSTPTVTFSVAGSTGIPTIAANDYIYRQGVNGNVMSGVNAWVPATVTATPFKGVDRSVHPVRLAGNRLTATTLQPRAAAIRMARLIHEGGAYADSYFLNSKDWEDLQLELQASGILVNTKAPAAKLDRYSFGIEYEGIALNGPAGVIKSFADPDRPVTSGFMTQMDTWTLASTGEFIQLIQTGGPNNLMVEESSDSFEGRYVSDHNLYTEAPYASGRVTLAA